MRICARNAKEFLAVLLIITLSYKPSNSSDVVHCEFPALWRGTWVSSSPHDEPSQPLIINNNSIQGRGECVLSRKVNGESHYFIFHKVIENKTCASCIFVPEERLNVIRFREFPDSEDCEFVEAGIDEFKELCEKIDPQDSFSALYRLRPEQREDCPFVKGEYTFSYQRSTSTCKNPNSKVHFCVDRPSVQLQYEACLDDGSQKDVKQIQCLGSWEDGDQKYLVAEIRSLNDNHGHRPVFRCLNIKTLRNPAKVVMGYEIAQSGDTSCHGLDSSTSGEENLVFTKVEKPTPTCNFPEWLRGGVWQLLNNGTRTIHVDGKHNDTLTEHAMVGVKRNNYTFEMLFVCNNITTWSAKKVTISGNFLLGCRKTSMRMTFYQRSRGAVELESHNHYESEEASWNGNDDNTSGNNRIKIYVKPNELRDHDRARCPLENGKYLVTQPKMDTNTGQRICGPVGWSGAFSQHLHIVGDKLSLYCDESRFLHKVFTCHSSWEKYGKRYFLASEKSSSSNTKFLCFTITKLSDMNFPSLELEASNLNNCNYEDISTPRLHVHIPGVEYWKFTLTFLESIEPQMINKEIGEVNSDEDNSHPVFHTQSHQTSVGTVAAKTDTQYLVIFLAKFIISMYYFCVNSTHMQL